MIRQKTGVVLESLRLRIKDGIATAANLGFKGIQIDATQREIAPENLSQTGRRELKRIVDLNRLCLCALGGELGVGFALSWYQYDLSELFPIQHFCLSSHRILKRKYRIYDRFKPAGFNKFQDLQ